MTNFKNSIKQILKKLRLLKPIVILYVAFSIECSYWRQRLSRPGIPVLVIDHNFVQDIEALRAAATEKNVNLISISFAPIYLLAELYFPPDIREGSYLRDEMAPYKRDYRIMLEQLLRLWNPAKRIHCFVTPSDSFFWIRELIGLLHDKRVPCIVVDKEGTISPHDMEHFSKKVSELFPFISDFIIVWSQRQREFWSRTGVPADKILIEGQPRSDFFLHPERWLSKETLVGKCKRLFLFFTFETDAYAPIPGDHLWRDLRCDLHMAIEAFARQYPDHVFVVKTHPQQRDRFQVEQEFARTGLKNIVVLHGAEIARHLIVQSDVIIGFQTTALIEGMLAGKKVIYTEWSSTVRDNLQNLIPFHEAAGIDRARSREEFESLLSHIIQHEDFGVDDDTMAIRKPFIDVFIPNADGNVSERVMNRIIEIVRNKSGVVDSLAVTALLSLPFAVSPIRWWMQTVNIYG